MPQRPPLSAPADWGMHRPTGSPVAGPGPSSLPRPGPMAGPMISRSNSVPGNTRSMLQQQLMDMGTSLLLYCADGPHQMICNLFLICYSLTTIIPPVLIMHHQLLLLQAMKAMWV